MPANTTEGYEDQLTNVGNWRLIHKQVCLLVYGMFFQGLAWPYGGVYPIYAAGTLRLSLPLRLHESLSNQSASVAS